ncbi:MAG: glycogen synthase [Anaerolinea sp.]|nr:glycogen synthase [Anaerolinea sp.]
MPATRNILFLASEAEPFVKVGGLADVAGSLPLALRALPGEPRLDVRLALPLHRAIQLDPANLIPGVEFSVSRGGINIPAQVFEGNLEGMPVYFIAGGPITEATAVYSNDLAFDREKYIFFSLAVLKMIRHLGWQPDILHGNDWHTALALYALRTRRSDPFFAPIRSVLTLHNLPYMGGDGSEQLAAYGLNPVEDEALPQWAHTQPLPLGLWAADTLVAVSPTYAQEILTPEFGCGLQNFLRGRQGAFSGILNGLDTASWDPLTDPALAANFDARSLRSRPVNKAALQERLGLQSDPDVPLLAMVGRIDPQKGVDIVLDALRQIVALPWQMVILGKGDASLEDGARRLEADFPGRVRAVIDYNAPLGRLIYGGADIFLMPSRYEPCGLAQMIAMRYGCVPLVRATGGLKDTVGEGQTGFLFGAASAEALAEAIRAALAVYPQREKWRKLQRNGMKQDFSWSRSASQYASLYWSLNAAY